MRELPTETVVDAVTMAVETEERRAIRPRH
jgi:hypothetical protein